MKERNKYLTKAFLAGLVMLLPLFILAILLRWVYGLVTGAMEPLSKLVVRLTGAPELLSELLVLVGVIGLILAVGIATRTTFGDWLVPRFHNYLQRVAPGYQMVRDIVHQLFGDKENSPFARGSVALVQLYGKEVPVTVTALLTSYHEDGTCTVFVPTGPNPTSGFIYHVDQSLIQLRPDIRVEAALRTVIACGTGAGALFGGPPPTDLPRTGDQPEPGKES